MQGIECRTGGAATSTRSKPASSSRYSSEGYWPIRACGEIGRCGCICGAEGPECCREGMRCMCFPNPKLGNGGMYDS